MNSTFQRFVSTAALAVSLGIAVPAASQTAPATPAPAEPAAPAAPAPAAPAAPAAEKPATPEAPAAAILPDIFLGAETAPVTIVEYASFTCPHCSVFHKDVFPKLKAEYIDTGKVRFAQRDVYFDEVGLWAGIVARCGGDDKFYPVGGMLLDEQKDWLSAKNGEELTANFKKIAAKAGMTGEQIEACWNDKAKVESLVATFQKNAVEDKIEGTPTFIINGEKVQNAPWEALKKKIDEKLAAAPAGATPAPAAAPATAPAPASN